MTKFYLTLKAFPNLWMQQHGSVMGRFGVWNGSVDRIYTQALLADSIRNSYPQATYSIYRMVIAFHLL